MGTFQTMKVFDHWLRKVIIQQVTTPRMATNAIRILTDFNEFSRIDSDPREFTRIDSDLLRFIQFFNVNFGNQFESNSCSPLIRILLQHGFDSN